MRELNNFQSGFLLVIIMVMTIFAINSDGGMNITSMIYRSSSVCGNDICENDESIGNCAVDCLGGCGDGVCKGIEEELCPEDCLYAPKVVYSKLSSIILTIFSLVALLIIIYWIKPIAPAKRKVRRRKRKTRRKRRR